MRDRDVRAANGLARRGFITRYVCLVLAILLSAGMFVGTGAPVAKAAGPAIIYASPADGAFPVGGTTFAVQVRLDTAGTSVNAVQAWLTFPADLLEVVGTPDTTGSFLQLWMPEVSVDNTLGLIRLAAGLPSGFDSGFTGDGLVATITFRTRSAIGTATIGFDTPNCAALQSSDNADVLGHFVPASRTINGEMAGALRLTRTTKVSGQRVVTEYELLDAGLNRIDLTSSTVQSLTMAYESGAPAAFPLDDTTGNIWFDVLNAGGTYHMRAVMKAVGGVSVAYSADLLWQPQTAAFSVAGAWVTRVGLAYIPFTCGVNVSAVDGLFRFDRTGANPQALPVTGDPDLYVSIALLPGTYRVVIADGGTFTIASLTQERTGDLNHDGVIDIFDASMLMAAWGPSAPTLEADINGDLVVDIFDAGFEISHWTPRP